MSWSYSLSELANSQRNQVRALIGDTDPSDQKIQDEEIDFFLVLRASLYGAAAECCRNLATQMSGDITANVASYRAGDTEIKNNNSSSSSSAKSPYLQLALAFELMASSSIVGAASNAMPYVGGISRADKEFYEEKEDLVQPSFAVGMFDDEHVDILSNN